MLINLVSLKSNFLKQTVNNNLSFKSNCKTPDTYPTDTINDYSQSSDYANITTILSLLDSRNSIKTRRNETSDVEKENLVQQSYQSIVKEANAKVKTVKDESRKLYYQLLGERHDAIRLLDAIQNPNFRGNAILKNNTIKMFDGKGDLFKKYDFYPSKELKSMEDYTTGKVVQYDESGKPVEAIIGLKEFANGSFQYAKEIEFEEDEYGFPALKSYREDYVWDISGSNTEGLHIELEDDKVVSYTKGSETSDGICRTADELLICDNVPYSYKKGDYYSPADNITKHDICVNFDSSGRPIAFEKDFVCSPENSCQLGLNLEYQNGKWLNIVDID